MPKKTTTNIRVSEALSGIIQEIARLEASTVAAVADRLFKQQAESELKRVRKQTMAKWETAAK